MILRRSKSATISNNEASGGKHAVSVSRNAQSACLQQVFRQNMRRDRRRRRQHHRALDHVLQFANISRPVMLHQNLHRLRLEIQGGPALDVQVLLVLAAEAREEVVNQQRDIFLPVAQRRQVQVDYVQAGSTGPRGTSPHLPASANLHWSRR